jgi:tetratricopeptide (TPR) repeat protein
MDLQKLEDLYQDAIRLTKSKDYTAAFNKIDEMHALLPNNDAVYLTSAAINMTCENYKGCIADSEKCVKINPFNASGWTHLGVAKCCLGEIAEGLVDIKKAYDLGLVDVAGDFNYWLRKLRESKLPFDNDSMEFLSGR